MQPRRPFGEYGVAKAQIEAYLIETARRDFRRPSPLNPAGHFNPDVFTALAKGEEVALPNFGLETVHHVHADDVAQLFMCAIAGWSASVGEAFHAGFARRVYASRLRRGNGGLVRPRTQTALSAVAGMEEPA